MDLAAAANVILAAVIGGRAHLVLNHQQIQRVFTTGATLAEVEEYVFVLAKKKRLRPDILLLTIAALPVLIVDRDEYAGSLAKA